MKLLLAVDIADRIIHATRRDDKLDIRAEADELVQRHPEAHVSVEEVVAVLAEEARAVRHHSLA